MRCPNLWGILKIPMEKLTRYAKVVILFIGVLAFRLLPWRAPNVEPILAAAMPLSKRSGALASTLFAALSIVVYDALTSGWGSWTIVTALAYALVGLASGIYFTDRAASRGQFVGFSIGAIFFYDAVTGLLPGPILEGQPFSVALYGQIPFTALHLLGAVAFAALVSPALYRWLEASPVTATAPQSAAI